MPTGFSRYGTASGYCASCIGSFPGGEIVAATGLREHHPHRMDEQDHATGDRQGADGEVQQDTQQLAEHDQDKGHGGRGDQHLAAHTPLRCRVKRRRDIRLFASNLGRGLGCRHAGAGQVS